MTAEPVLTLAWLALAHLVADFVIQTNWIATTKFGFGRRAWQALGMHWLGAAICMLPFVFAFGLPGLAALVVISLSHAVIDRVKIVWTMRVEARAVADARAVAAGAHAAGESRDGMDARAGVPVRHGPGGARDRDPAGVGVPPRGGAGDRPVRVGRVGRIGCRGSDDGPSCDPDVGRARGPRDHQRARRNAVRRDAGPTERVGRRRGRGLQRRSGGRRRSASP